MTQFSVAELPKVAWVNKGGFTRELAALQEAGSMVWRVSVADIQTNGPFSRFPDLARVHTIIDGAGLDLAGDDVLLRARPLQPLRFDGGTALEAVLLDGPCRALNVIYDPARIDPTVTLYRTATDIDVQVGDIVFVVAGAGQRQAQSTLQAGEALHAEHAQIISPVNGSAILHVRLAAVEP